MFEQKSAEWLGTAKAEITDPVCPVISPNLQLKEQPSVWGTFTLENLSACMELSHRIAKVDRLETLH